MLDEAQREAYRRRGYHAPLRAVDAGTAAVLARKFLAYRRANAAALDATLPRERSAYWIDTHLFQRWTYEIAAHPAVLDAVESVLGADVMLWSSQWFPKMPGAGDFVSWHQDATYWGLNPPNVTTAWIALTAATPENGCMRVIPSTHRGALLPQRETFGPANMLSRGQEIAVEVNEAEAVDLVLAPGEFSLHHVGIVHGSAPNRSDGARIGLAVRYISPDVVQAGSERDMVLLLRGTDRHGHFDVVPPPEHDVERQDSAVHAESLARKRRNIMPQQNG